MADFVTAVMKRPLNKDTLLLYDNPMKRMLKVECSFL